MRKTIVTRPVPDQALSGSELHPLLRRLYAARGISGVDELDYQLTALAKPQWLRDVDRAARHLFDAIERGCSILVVGDFDADGATSTAVAILGLGLLCARHLDYRVPSRFSDGYGLTSGIIEALRAEGRLPDLLLTVDNGIAAHEGVERAREAGVEVVVTDHHLPGESLPPANAIVNPNQPGCDFPSSAIAGVGVIFYVLSALRALQREAGWFPDRQPPLADLLDLVALGTVADVVPLDQNNRILVEQGLKRIRAGRTRPGIRALLEVSGRDPALIQASDLGFALGPRLNAAGRLDDMSVGIECLLTEDETRAGELARELDALNRERRSIETGMQQEAEVAVASLSLDQEALPGVLCLFDESWHEGVIGLLASRLKEKFHRPVIAFALDGDGQLKGSARSIPGVHMRDLLTALDVREPGLITRYGGHAMAAGLSLPRVAFERLRSSVNTLIDERVAPEVFAAELMTDGELESEYMTLDTARMIAGGGPWGQSFPEPVFRGEFRLREQRIVGERHLKLLIEVPEEQSLVDGIAFGVDTDVWPSSAQWALLVYQMDVNRYRGVERLQLRVIHMEPLDG